MTKHYTQVSNPGSAIGEAIGASMESAIKRKLEDIAAEHGCHYLTSGVRQTKSGRAPSKLLMSDNSGNEYDIDGIITNESLQPLILFESKYIRYKKHNRDKGSWICHSHSSVRRRYHSIRSSIAILAGNWSMPSRAMMKSNDINLFITPFEYICDVLLDYGIDFNWEEKDKEKAKAAWYQYNTLTQNEKDRIGEVLVEYVEDDVLELIDKILDNKTEREVEKVIVELVSNLGEYKIYEFDDVEDALDFLDDECLEEQFLTTDSFSLLDPPPEIQD
ncbi:TPA: hypothetical protein NJ487_004414 [Vibrio parahaemolyticus]|nr:hypothetical protein [Vibrio parahaemolyticus]